VSTYSCPAILADSPRVREITNLLTLHWRRSEIHLTESQ
jgi:hypothetical protein